MKNGCKIHEQAHVKELKRNGLKLTRIRLNILDIFEHAAEPLSAKSVRKQLGGIKADAATVYRNLESMTKAGILTQVFLSQDQAFFELSGRAHHHHAVCLNCGSIKDVPAMHNAQINDSACAAAGFGRIYRHSLEFFGLCQRCFKKKPNHAESQPNQAAK